MADMMAVSQGEFVQKDRQMVATARKFAKSANPGIVWRAKMMIRRIAHGN